MTMLGSQTGRQVFKCATLGCDNSAFKISLVYTITMADTSWSHAPAEAAAGAGWMCS